MDGDEQDAQDGLDVQDETKLASTLSIVLILSILFVSLQFLSL
jgi:hypothetical protein